MPVDNTTHGWVATLSDGTVAAEHSDNWEIIEGQPKPWARLCLYLAENNQTITSLRYNANGRTYHMPRADVRWGKGGVQPLYYAIEHIIEGTMEEGQSIKEAHFVDIQALYGEPSVHLIIELGGQEMSWIELRNGYKPQSRLAKGRIISDGTN